MTQPDAAGAMSTFFFYLLAAITGGSAVAMVVSRSIVRTAVWLLVALTGVAGIYFLLDAEFLAALQLVIYVGGTLVLIVFGVMLTSSSPFGEFAPTLVEVVVALTAGVILIGGLAAAVWQAAGSGEMGAVATPGGYVTSSLGMALVGQYVLPFELSSVLLLVVMIGAAYLARGRKRQPSATANSALSEEARRWS